MENNDINIIICFFLNDIDKLSFLSTSQTFNSLKIEIFFNDIINLYKIINLYYFERFTNIFAYHVGPYPEYITLT